MATQKELQRIGEQIAHLKRLIQQGHRMGTVEKVEKGKVLVSYGDGDLGDNGKKLTSAWIRTGHGGGMSEDRLYAKGETVHVHAAGGNAEHAYLRPGGYSDNHPLDGNATEKNNTRRWRKPPEDQQGQQGGEADGGGEGTYGNSKNDGQKWKDDKDDHQEDHTHERRWHKIGEYEFTGTKDGVEMKHGDRSVKIDKDSVVLKQGGASFTMKGGKLVVKAEDIVLDGNVHLGGEGGKLIGIQGSIDTKGDALVSALAKKVYAT